jgi:hypothetical protein
MALRSEIKIKFGIQGFAAAHVQGLGQVLDNEGFAYLRQKFLKIDEA